MAWLRGVRSTEGLRGRWAAVLPALGVALAPVLGGCAGDRIVIGGQRPPPLSELAGPDAGDGRDGGSSGGGIGTPARCPESPGERRQLLGCWPTRQVGRWQGFWLGLPRYEMADGEAAEFPQGDVVMRFGDDGAGTFSVGNSSPIGAVACVPGVDAGACASVGEVLGGFEYRLEAIRLQDAGERGAPRVIGEAPPRAGERMEFAVRLGEPWDAWCSTETPEQCRGGTCPSAQTGEKSSLGHDGPTLGQEQVTCRCGADGCVSEAPTLPLALTMSDDGLALRGAYRPRDPNLPSVSVELARVDP